MGKGHAVTLSRAGVPNRRHHETFDFHSFSLNLPYSEASLQAGAKLNRLPLCFPFWGIRHHLDDFDEGFSQVGSLGIFASGLRM
jgi:hypothetical protein